MAPQPHVYVFPSLRLKLQCYYSHHTCGQYIDNVINNGTAQYADAYFELNYIRAFSVNASNVVDSGGNPVSASPSAPFTTSAGASATSGVSGAATSGAWGEASWRAGSACMGVILSIAAGALLVL